MLKNYQNKFLFPYSYSYNNKCLKFFFFFINKLTFLGAKGMGTLKTLVSFQVQKKQNNKKSSRCENFATIVYRAMFKKRLENKKNKIINGFDGIVLKNLSLSKDSKRNTF